MPCPNGAAFAKGGVMTNPKLLRQRFQYQFAGPNIGITIARGWYPGFARLCADIDHLLGTHKRLFHWVQVKEKFGSACYYWALDRQSPSITLSFVGNDGSLVSSRSAQISDSVQPDLDDLARQISGLVSAATKNIRHACILCGRPGMPDLSDGYVLVLCPQHAEERQNDRLPDWWFDADES